jgi:arylformamidase
MNRVMSIDKGDICNLTKFEMCAHNGTHVDAPYHFENDGKTIDEVGLVPYVGDCFVAHHDGDITAAAAETIIAKARAAGAAKRILVEGDATMTEEGAVIFAQTDMLLYGNESQTVGPMQDASAVHHIMLGKGICLLEGVVLKDVAEGRYYLSAAPLNLGGCDGAPCRAVLMSLDL